jgi:hypothetical protein
MGHWFAVLMPISLNYIQEIIEEKQCMFSLSLVCCLNLVANTARKWMYFSVVCLPLTQDCGIPKLVWMWILGFKVRVDK